ncbi:unnamed protein product [Bursaphelenchus xylophilus]|uniref:(pine wood nematode) hypothetical protein n=1 Tax=Bursaphelenchus xylophilus TaxID=6326 RepID=A0A7I8X518_BURXY|nr:unnamed protein product [Bursaphelenchus xylophilus]CAG9122429.1 unnamed protein product [Bursaphelenchus xylophilus]
MTIITVITVGSPTTMIIMTTIMENTTVTELIGIMTTTMPMGGMEIIPMIITRNKASTRETNLTGLVSTTVATKPMPLEMNGTPTTDMKLEMITDMMLALPMETNMVMPVTEAGDIMTDTMVITDTTGIKSIAGGKMTVFEA